MTAASESLTGLAFGARTKPISGLRRMVRRWERALLVVAVCLPVPVSAASGLSIPLPATVERVVVALVPWSDAGDLGAAESPTVAAEGAIILVRHEIGATPTGDEATRRDGTVASRPAPTNGADSRPKKKRRKPGTSAGAGGESGSSGGGGSGGGGESSGGGGSTGGGSGGGSGGGGSTSGGSGGGSSGSSGPVGNVIDDVGSATQPVVDGVDDEVDDAVGTTGDVVDDVGNTTDGVLSGAGL